MFHFVQRGFYLLPLFLLAAIAVPSNTKAQVPVPRAEGRVPGANTPAPGNLQLLPGYEHRRLRGIDSVPGEIAKKDGLKIFYDIGRITQPGQPAYGGDFNDQALATSRNAAQLEWYKEQVVGGKPVHIAYGKDHGLHVTFPANGINFYAKANTTEEVAEVLLMLMTYDHAAPRR